jgi:hypothetical protein
MSTPLKVFVSYSHAQGDWVLDRLVPCLKAGGAEVLIDVERFRAGGGVYRQMDAVQDDADRQVLVVSTEYLASQPCQHEMERAIARDPAFEHHIVQPVRRDDAVWPDTIKLPDPLYVDLRDDTKPAPWALLLRECEATLGVLAPDWLTARDTLREKLDDRRSVNFVVERGVQWRGLIDDIMARPGKSFPVIHMNDGQVVLRNNFIETILDILGAPQSLSRISEDLAILSRVIGQRTFTQLALLNFDFVKGRRSYDKDLHGALRYLIREARPPRLQLLIQSHAPFAELLPGAEFNSEDFLDPVFLRAQP